MKSNKPGIDDERDTSLGLPDSYLDHHKPGFKPADKKHHTDPEGDHRFPRVAEEKDVPRTPLSERIGQRK